MKGQQKDTAIIIKRPTRLEQLKSRFNTKDQAKFYIKQNKVAFKQKKIMMKAPSMSKEELMVEEAEAFDEAEREYSEYEIENEQFYESLDLVQKQLNNVLNVKILEQNFISNYIFSDKDLIIVLGQDGLVANTAKYVNGLPIIGVNPDVNRFDGVLLPYLPNNFMTAVNAVLSNIFTPKYVTMAEVKLNDGQSLLAFNDFYIGMNSHTSSRYTIEYNGLQEDHSSSGVIVSTGAGSTGWLSSFFNMTNGFIREFAPKSLIEYVPFAKDAKQLMFAVREPFVSRTSQANIIVGKIFEGEILKIESNMPKNGVIFSDGIHQDYLEFNSGTIAEISIAKQQAVIV
ncbi:MAG: NAD(+)/NADH kinase [Bacteroidales bacterium]|nr:NAD(+)/NADH kinase [Bacteroidales bacterium]